ncbi:hypothetical protein BDN70DRAFT_901283 [Pholiota conissans]|uniref:Uncharacterized protein n=1 Tax=Pholiota conissans TaxID=109636 RepID=A0A9P6CLS8_9AGAR|nr:hypothetical protein BDN70DRAFT_901283 [Pholiota conissans]
MWALSLKKGQDNTRDAIFVQFTLQYAMYVDENEQHPQREMCLHLQTFYGQLENIFLLKFQDLNARRALKLDAAADTDVIILAAVRMCNIAPPDPDLRGLDIHFYSNMGALHMIDALCLQCIVGESREA